MLSFHRSATHAFPDDEKPSVVPNWQELELATRILSLRDPSAISRCVQNVAGQQGAGRSAWGRPSAWQQLDALLGGVARRVLPQWKGRASTGLISRGRLLGLELEGLSPEDQELELARQYLRLALAALRRIDATRAHAIDVRTAFREVARRHAPGLFRIPHPSRRRRQRGYALPMTGRWYRRGSTITLRPQ